jgi:hypothetical protein
MTLYLKLGQVLSVVTSKRIWHLQENQFVHHIVFGRFIDEMVVRYLIVRVGFLLPVIELDQTNKTLIVNQVGLDVRF